MFTARLARDEESNVHVLELAGNFTLDEKSRVDGLVGDADSCDCLGLVLDLSGVTYIDSAGLMTALGAFHRLGRAGKALVLSTGGNRYVQDKLTEIGLGHAARIGVFDSVEEARRDVVRASLDPQRGDG